MELHTLVRLYAQALEREIRSSPVSRLNFTLAVLWILLFIVTYWVSAEAVMQGLIIMVPGARILRPIIAANIVVKQAILVVIPLLLGTVKSAVAYAGEKKLFVPHNTAGALRCVVLTAQDAGVPFVLVRLPLYILRGMGAVLIWFIAKLFLVLAAIMHSMREFEGKEVAFGYEEIPGDVDDLPGATDGIASIMRRYREEVLVCETTEKWMAGEGVLRKLFLLVVWVLFGEFGHIEGRDISILARHDGYFVGGKAERVRTFYVEARKTLLFSLVASHHDSAVIIEREMNTAFHRTLQGEGVDISVFVKEILGTCKEPHLEENDVEILLMKLDALIAR